MVRWFWAARANLSLLLESFFFYPTRKFVQPCSSYTGSVITDTKKRFLCVMVSPPARAKGFNFRCKLPFASAERLKEKSLLLLFIQSHRAKNSIYEKDISDGRLQTVHFCFHIRIFKLCGVNVSWVLQETSWGKHTVQSFTLQLQRQPSRLCWFWNETCLWCLASLNRGIKDCTAHEMIWNRNDRKCGKYFPKDTREKENDLLCKKLLSLVNPNHKQWNM